MRRRLRGVLVALAACLALVPRGSRAQREVPARAGRGAVRGIVFDSLNDRPLVGAVVQLVARDAALQGRTLAARSDSAGRFRLADVPAGTYVAGFFHPVLDSLGLESDEQLVQMDAAAIELDFALPSPATLRNTICPETAGDSTGVLFGQVRSTATHEGLPGATIAASWTELDLGGGFIRSNRKNRSVASAPDGWFALCAVPAATPLMLVASAERDSSGLVRASVAARSARHVTLTVGGARRESLVAAPDAAGAPRLVWRGDSHLRGEVRDSAGRPVAGAGVTVWGTERRATTGRAGAFALDSLPGGTQTLEVRAIGYEPVERVVQLASGAPVEARVILHRRVVALPTVAVTSAAPARRTARLIGFFERRELAARGINHGYFLTEEDIEKRHLPFFTGLVRDLPGIHVVHAPGSSAPQADQIGGPLLEANNKYCKMTIYLDGIRVANSLARDPDPINLLVHPGEVAAIEVYPYPVGVPPEYQALNGKCGVILIWTK